VPGLPSTAALAGVPRSLWTRRGGSACDNSVSAHERSRRRWSDSRPPHSQRQRRDEDPDLVPTPMVAGPPKNHAHHISSHCDGSAERAFSHQRLTHARRLSRPGGMDGFVHTMQQRGNFQRVDADMTHLTHGPIMRMRAPPTLMKID